MKKLFLLLIASVLTACSAQAPITNYTPQDVTGGVKYQGNANIGQFTYAPFEQGIVRSNQIQNTAVGNIYLGTDIADFVQKATLIELERAGIKQNNTNVTVTGRIKEFKADDLGYSVDWSYIINYKLIDSKTSAILLDRDYVIEPLKTSKFDLTIVFNSISKVVYLGYARFINDPDVRRILSR